MKYSGIVFLVAVSWFFMACGAEDDTESVSPPQSDTAVVSGDLTYYEHVKPIMDAFCVTCHSTGAIREQTPMDTFADVSNLGALVKNHVVDRIMPPWHAGTGCNQYLGDPSLSEEQIATVSQWVDQGAVEGDASSEGAPIITQEYPSIREDVVVTVPEPYTPSVVPDDYRCFLIPWPEKGTKYITGFKPYPDNEAIVHHIIAFLIPPGEAEKFNEFDANEEGPGYTCFGAPVPPDANITGQEIQWLGAWAPGGNNGPFPEGTGLQVEEGSLISLQVHYNATAPGVETDQTSVSFMIEDEVDEVAMVLPWTNFLLWVQGQQMHIPAGEGDATHSFAYDPTPFLGGGFTIHAASLHMHLRGKSARTYIKRANGDEECLLTIPNWDFGWQRSYPLSKTTVFNPGDKLGLECHWDNSPANQPWIDGEQLVPMDINWGEGSTDEMCLGVYYISGMNNGLPF
jgi:hypothetical protein